MPLRRFAARSFDFETFAVVGKLKHLHALVRRVVRLVECQIQLPVEAFEYHAVPAVLPEEDFVLRPGACDFARRRRTHEDAISVPFHHVGPYHVKPPAFLRAVEERAVRDVCSPFHRALRVEKRLGRFEERREIGRERRVFYRAVPHLAPFVAIDHVGLAVFDVKRSVERLEFRRRDGPHLHGLERSRRLVGREHPRAAGLEAPLAYAFSHRLHVASPLLFGNRDEKPVFAVEAVDLGRPHGLHIDAFGKDHRRLLRRPGDEVGAAAHVHALPAVPRFRFVKIVMSAVDKDERIADLEVRFAHRLPAPARRTLERLRRMDLGRDRAVRMLLAVDGDVLENHPFDWRVRVADEPERVIGFHVEIPKCYILDAANLDAVLHDNLHRRPAEGTRVAVEHDIRNRHPAFVVRADVADGIVEEYSVGAACADVLEDGVPYRVVRRAADSYRLAGAVEDAVGNDDVLANRSVGRLLAHRSQDEAVVAGAEPGLAYADVAACVEVDPVGIDDPPVVVNRYRINENIFAKAYEHRPTGRVLERDALETHVAAADELDEPRARQDRFRPQPLVSAAFVAAREKLGALPVDHSFAGYRDVLFVPSVKEDKPGRFGTHCANVGGEVEVILVLHASAKDCALFEMQLHMASQAQRLRFMDAGGDGHTPAALCGGLVYKLLEIDIPGFGGEHCKRAKRQYGSRFDFHADSVSFTPPPGNPPAYLEFTHFLVWLV